MQFYEEEEVPPQVEEFYYWDSLDTLLRVYLVAKNYLTEARGLEPVILLKLIELYELDMKEAIHAIPFIHINYINTVTATPLKEST
jgi:hypothetical protein